jgi:hypothetical protein
MTDDKGKSDPDDAHLAFAYIAYAAVFGALFRKDILPVVSEKLLLVLTVLFWYGFAATFYRGTIAQIIMMSVALVPSALTVHVALTRPPLNFWLKLFLYTWFLMIVVALGLFQFPYGNLRIFTEHRVPWMSAADALATGMALVYLVVNAMYLYLLIPIPGKTQSFGDRMKQWHELTDLMTQRCTEDEPTHAQALLTVGIIGALAFVNYAFHLIPASLFISGTLIVCAFLLHAGVTQEVLAAAAAAQAEAVRLGHNGDRANRKRSKSQRLV